MAVDRRIRFVGRAALAAALAGMGAPRAQAQETIVYRGALVWTGSGFARRDLATRGGRFIAPRQAGAGAREVSLAGRFVVPAYGNAHAHLTNATRQGNDYYLANGVFYVWNMNTVVQNDAVRAFFARPDTYDVRMAMGGITEPGGHPEALYVRDLAPRVYPGMTLPDFVGNAFHYGRTRQEIDAALDLLVRQRADFVKALLLHSEDYARRRDDPAYYGQRGLNPANVAYLVAAARRRGLNTAFHVETVPDLLAAARARAAVAAHLPGYGYARTMADLERWRLSETQARDVARSNMLLVPTYSLAGAYEGPTPVPARAPIIAAHRALLAENLRRLSRAGATFLIGTDQQGDIFVEAEFLAGLAAFRPAALLGIVLGTGRRMFPDRRLGCFQPGCEADFLVLRENPLRDFRALRSIETRIMAGTLVGASPASGP